MKIIYSFSFIEPITGIKVMGSNEKEVSNSKEATFFIKELKKKLVNKYGGKVTVDWTEKFFY